ncbi:EVE domain-containing protein [Dehalococcoidia bacterium]|nr:EVE domain-containing protein [Dehalococcoidia bacterium]
MAGRYWLFKSEPGAYSYDDLVKDGIGEWDGVRNFQARNLLRDEIKIGDRVLFYHSNTNPPAVMGTAIVTRNGYPDHTAWDPGSAHPDPKSTPANPIWYMVDIKADERLANPVTLQSIRDNTKISNMVLVRRGMRLSVQPVTQLEFETILAMGKEH